MHNQSPATNDPANPLMEAAALSLERIYPDEKDTDQFRLAGKLNFKFGSGMHGSARTKAGEPVSVLFSLAIRRAIFEVTVSSDDTRLKAADKIRLSKVAFAKPAQQAARVTETATSTKGSHLKAAAGVHVDPSKLVTAPLDAIGALGHATGGVDRENKQHRQVSSSQQRTSISVTHTNERAHWQIESLADCALASAGDYLQGDVFMTPANKQPIDIFHVTRKPDSKASLSAEGSVYVLAQDLHVSDVQFTDADGCPIDLGAVEGGSTGIWPDKRKAQDRLVRQIIRKHLETNGMRIDGARIEICRAHA